MAALCKRLAKFQTFCIQALHLRKWRGQMDRSIGTRQKDLARYLCDTKKKQKHSKAKQSKKCHKSICPCVCAFIAPVWIENKNKSAANKLGALKSCTCLLNGEWKTGLVEPRSRTWWERLRGGVVTMARGVWLMRVAVVGNT